MLRTGTSKNGQVYRYYTCANCATKGKTVCKGRSIPMHKLDTLVTAHLIERLFRPEPVAAILASLSSGRTEKLAAQSKRLLGLQREMADADDKLRRLYELVEKGLTDVDEVLKERLDALKADRDQAKAALERAKDHLAVPIAIDPALIERFGRTMRENFSTGSVPFRKAYLRSLIDIIEVDEHQIRIKGSKDLLEKAVLATRNGQLGCSQMSTRWRARKDSNLRRQCAALS
jgi:site-specific DNA recombinase